jgi:colanic acid biosynthesis glycosyl transferase WcaI
MRILFLGLNFWPEPTGIGKYSGEMAEYLSQAGHKVTVITTPAYYPHWRIQPPYDHKHGYQREQWNGVEIIRCPLYVPQKVTGIKRIIHLLSFSLSSLPVVLKEKAKRPDLIFTVEPSLFAAISVNRGKNKRVLTWLHVQDFELDAALELGLLKRIPFVESLARTWESKVYRNFTKVSTISHAMEDRLREKQVPQQSIYYFPNWIDTAAVFPLSGVNQYREKFQFMPNDLVLLYSGSIGQKQGAEILIEAAKRLFSNEHIHLVICGEGPGKLRLQELAQGSANIHFLPVQPAESLNELLNMADIHLLPQRAGAADLVMPSKLLGILASGRPVISTCQKGSELYSIVERTGLAVPPEDCESLVEAIVELANDENRRRELGKKGRDFVCQNFSKDKILSELVSTFIDMVDNRDK